MNRVHRFVVGVAVICTIAAMALTASALAGSKAAGRTSGGGLGSQFDVSKAGNVTLTMWWLGNQEVPGIEKWMAQTIAKYHRVSTWAYFPRSTSHITRDLK